MISDAELTTVSSDVALFLPESCAILRPTVVRDADGYDTETVATVATDVPCRVAEPLAARETVAVGRIQTQGDATIYLPATVDVTTRDRVAVTFRRDGRQQTYEVVGVAGPRSFAVLGVVAAAAVPV